MGRMPHIKLLREHVYNGVAECCECELPAAKSPMTKDEWVDHVNDVIAASSLVVAAQQRYRLRRITKALVALVHPGTPPSDIPGDMLEAIDKLAAGLLHYVDNSTDMSFSTVCPSCLGRLVNRDGKHAPFLTCENGTPQSPHPTFNHKDSYFYTPIND